MESHSSNSQTSPAHNPKLPAEPTAQRGEVPENFWVVLTPSPLGNDANQEIDADVVEKVVRMAASDATSDEDHDLGPNTNKQRGSTPRKRENTSMHRKHHLSSDLEETYEDINDPS